MTDEFKTLLRIDGDASGAKKAAEETKSAMQASGAAEQQVATASAEASQKTAKALEDKAGKAGQAKSGFDKLAQSMGLSRQEANDFREAVSRLSPELGALLNTAMKGEGIFKTLFSSIGYATIASIAAVQGLTYALREAEASAQRSLAEARKVAELQERIRSRERARTEDVSEVMARGGKVGAAVTGAAQALEKQFVAQGFSADAVRKVLPFAIDESGQRVLNDDEIANLAAMETYGKGQLDFSGPEGMPSVLRRAQQAARRDPALVAKWRDAIRQRQERLTEGASRGVAADVAKILAEGPENVPEKQMEEAVADIKSVAAHGRVDEEGLNLWNSEKDRLIWERRQRDAARRAHAMGIISAQDATRASGIAASDVVWGGVREDLKEADQAIQRVPGVSQAYQVQKAAIRGAAEGAGRVTNYITNNSYNHGTIVNGRPNTAPVQRAVAP